MVATRKQIIYAGNSDEEYGRFVRKIAQLKLEYGDVDGKFQPSKLFDNYAHIGGITTGKFKTGVDLDAEELAMICTDGESLYGATVVITDSGKFEVVDMIA